jgi:hypothetical protein
MILMDLPDEAQRCLKGIDPTAARSIKNGLKDFKQRAEQALNLSSIFYLSALLYPEDYKVGERNDLERFVEEIKKNLPR